MDPKTWHEKIEDYVKGRLPEAERHAFEIEMAFNSELAAEVARYKDINPPGREQEMMAFRTMMEGILGETPAQAPAPQGRKPWWFFGILLFLLVCAIGIWQFSDLLFPVEPEPAETKILNSTPATRTALTVEPEPVEPEPVEPERAETEPVETETPQKQIPLPAEPTVPPPAASLPNYRAMAMELYNRQSYEVSLRDIAEPSEEETLLQKAEQAYRDSNFAEVIRLLAKPVAGYTVESAKLRAHAYFNSGKYNMAAVDFHSLRNSRYKYDAEWYMLLCYVSQLPETRAQFDALADQIIKVENHSFRKGTLELLEIIKQ
ncbi:MAG: hypothetical protein IPG32_06495 [Saprospirales bacterium]|nr:hypothetical protein [Saprospirales bacterium]